MKDWRGKMGWVLRFYNSTIGMKVVMAVSGAALFAFVILHTVGNLQVFLGEEVFNHYAEMIQGNPELLWSVRLGVLTAIVAHVISSVRLVFLANAARPQAYKVKKTVATTYAARTMRFSGPIVFAYLFLHILHLTTGNLHPDFKKGDAYHNFVTAFAADQWYIAVGYAVCQILLGLHLFHGAYSMFRTLGLSGPRQLEFARWVAHGITAFIVLGNVILPLSVVLGLVK